MDVNEFMERECCTWSQIRDYLLKVYEFKERECVVVSRRKRTVLPAKYDASFREDFTMIIVELMLLWLIVEPGLRMQRDLI